MSILPARHLHRQPGLLLCVAASVLAAALVSSPPAQAEAIHQIVSYGQSVSLGTGAVPPISTEPHPSNLMFSSGVRAQFGEGDAAANRASLVPFQESRYYWLGETPVAGMLQMIDQMRMQEDGHRSADLGIRYLGSAPGKGGQTVKALSFGSSPFEQLIWDLYFGHAHARVRNAEYRLGAVTWGQGESDQYWGTDAQTYRAGVDALRRQIDWVNEVITGSAERVPMIAYQVSAHLAAGSARPDIALAQLELGRTQPDFHLATPLYMMDFVDEFHLDARSSKWLGAYFGLVYKRVVIDGGRWQPLLPLRARSIDRVVVVDFHVPVPPLVFDTVQVADPGQYGFRVVDPDGRDNPITGIAIDRAGTRVWIAAARPIAAGSSLRYAWDGDKPSGRLTGPRGNLRDSQGDRLVFDPQGIAAPMHNWCVIFELSVEPL
ncbi:hypothetical protein [Sinimarinibacterium thermocellulolyticum]|uniref:Sialate O-acetylesterase domain-containing protein n=1 Tax=Sinimarinibacterium thermocellulolyticum TaxID=3170016 RepID=A0ABV2ADF9_9GAMM